MSTPLTVVGAPGSPYTRKLRAAMRYRQIPHRFVIRNSKSDHDIPDVPVALIPVLVVPGEAGAAPTAAFDTTPLIRRLEALHSGRSVVPPDPGLAFIDALLEDYADEWVTKMMFHYRWAYQADIDKAGSILPRWSRVNVPEDAVSQFSKMITERQVGRLWVVGSNQTTGPVIEASYRRLLERLDAHLTTSRFVMGARPGAADFGLYGQLTQLAAFDPTPAAVTLEEAPRVAAWVDLVEELSGLEPADSDWMPRDAVPESFRALLAEIGRVYVPFLLANAAALAQSAEKVECEIDGRPWLQRPFPYQGKCLGWLREGHAALGGKGHQALGAILAGTGCEPLFA